MEIGLGYLSLDRPSGTLSGGEAQRTKMIRHLGSSLTDVTYVFDERCSRSPCSCSPVCTCSCCRMPPSGAAGDPPTERAAGRTTKGRVAHTRMARRTEMKMVRIHAGVGCAGTSASGIAELKLSDARLRITKGKIQ